MGINLPLDIKCLGPNVALIPLSEPMIVVYGM